MKLPHKLKQKKIIYLDHAAATPLDTEAYTAMKPYLTEEYGNPSSVHKLGVHAQQAITAARETIATICKTQPDTIVFTASGTESCNMAILGIARAHSAHGKHIITTQIEHDAVLQPLKQLEKEGFDVTYLPVNARGEIAIEDFKSALRTDTILVSIMYANNEIGTIAPIAEIGREILKWRKAQNQAYPYFHTDACQTTTTLPLEVEHMHVDLATMNSSKMYGPKGAGVLYCRRGVHIEPLYFGGGQERRLRAGTQNVAAIVGMATAYANTQKKIKTHEKKLRNVSKYFIETLKKYGVSFEINGLPIENHTRLAHNINLRFPGIEGEKIVLYLDAYGICVSSASACSNLHDNASHVLLACGKSQTHAQESVRFTLGKVTTKKDLRYVAKMLSSLIQTFEEVH